MTGPLNIIALITPKAGKSDRVEQLLKTAAQAVKEKEPGTLRYHLHRETKGDAPTFIMLETYKNLEALKAHGSSTHFREMGKRFKDEDLLEGPIKPLFIEERGGFASKL